MDISNGDDVITNSQKIYKCDCCDKVFSRKQDQKRHVSAVHDGKKSFQCHICLLKTSFQNNLKKHIREVHKKDEKKFKCEKCPSTFGRKEHLQNHISCVTYIFDAPFRYNFMHRCLT